MKKTDKQRLFEAFEKVCNIKLIKEESTNISISDLADQMHSLPEKSLKTTEAIDTLINLISKLDRNDARKFVKDHLYHSPNDGHKVSGDMVFSIPRPMGKNVQVPISPEMTNKLKSYL
jgi:hypothetical protein